MNNKPINFPQKSNADKTAEALNALAGLQNAIPRMVQIPVEKYDELVRAKLQLDIIAESLKAFPDYLFCDLVRTVLGIPKADPASNANPLSSEDNADAEQN